MKLSIAEAWSKLDAAPFVINHVRDALKCQYWEESGMRTEYPMEEDGTFYTGLWKFVRKEAKKYGELVVEDQRVRPGMAPDMERFSLVNITPLPFQHEAVAAAMKHGNGIVKATTAAGKSVCIFGCTQVVPDINWLVVTADKKVAAQLASKYEQLTEEKASRMIESGRWTGGGNVTFATFSQLEARMYDTQVANKLASFQGVIVDEVHTVASPTRMKVMGALVAAYYRIGFSATPFGRSDNKHEFVVGATGPQVYEIEAQELIEMERVAKPIVRFVEFQHAVVRTRPMSLYDYNAAYRTHIMANKDRNELVCDIVDVAEKPCIVFIERITHGKSLMAAMKKRGWTAKFIAGTQTSMSTAEQYISDMRKGIVDVIVSTKVMDAGVDIPNLMSVVIAGAGKANIATVQRTGRPMRRPDGKDECEYWDIKDVGQFENQAAERARHLKKEGHEVQLVPWEDFRSMQAQRSS
jgi:superfamily II DNA or RNA helicase